MKTIKKRFRKGIALLLACTMMAGVVTAMPGNIVNVKAATVDPSVTAYATKAQLNGDTFTPGGDGKSDTIGKLVFGKNSSGNPQEWYILGKDTGVSGENTILFAASSITAKSKFAPRSPGVDPDEISISEIPSDDIRATLKDTYTYEDGLKYNTVYRNHYGISTLRADLRDLAQNTNYFTVTEQSMMNPTLVKTYDTKNGLYYTTDDKLYALKDGTNGRIYAGSSDSTAIYYIPYWNKSEPDRYFWLWLRTPAGVDVSNQKAFWATESGISGTWWVNSEEYVHPATNLNLTDVLFASAAKAPSSGTVEAGPITEGTAMTLRLDGSGKTIGIVEYNITNDVITAQNDVNAAGPVSLVIQGKNGETDWFYSVKLGSKTVVTKAQIEAACGISDISLANCKIWLETTIDNVTYAKEATQTNDSNGSLTNYINSVEVTGVDAPVANADFDTEALCSTTGIAKTSITFLTTGENGEEEAFGKADWNKSYKAKITLNPGAVGDIFYEFNNSVSVTLNGVSLDADNFTINSDGTLTITTQEFTKTARRKIVSVTAPTVPSTFTNYYGHEGYDPILSNGGNGELGTQAEVTFETDVPPTTKAMDVTWTIESAGEGVYNNTSGASNTFRWTITDSSIADYNITNCPGYDSSKAAITGTVTIANKAATPVTITGTDSSIEYTGEVIDVSQYFNIDANAGSATYSDVTVSGDGKGVGTLVGNQLTVTQTGEFQIKVNTAANGIYAAGEKTITLTVGNGNIQYTMSDYSGIYDGQPHSISLTGLVPDDATVTYSTDGTTFGTDNPAFINVASYPVYYSISKDNYNTSSGSKTVTINKKPVTVKADEQDIIWGNAIAPSSYLADGLVTGDSIAEITLSPSTTALTDNGTISVSGIKIVNALGVDVTGNYDITTQNGTLKIAHDTTLPLDRIEAVKTKTSYTAGDTLNVDDITVTAYYSDGYSVAVTGFTTNADAISMSEIGDKTLTVSYTEKGITKTADLAITVSEKPKPDVPKSDNYQIIDGANSSYAAGGGEELSIRGNGDFSKFAGVKVDGNLVDPNYYTAKEGSTIIILKSSYMNTLSAGTHTFEILWTDGSASTTFTINANPADSNSQSSNDSANQNNNSNTNVSLQNNANKKDAVPKTGDTTPIAGLFVLTIISGIGLLVTEKRAKKDC
ncbi:MAG: bacterial Ig-like domain-containing protein [Lachnospiraceae bacterium]